MKFIRIKKTKMHGIIIDLIGENEEGGEKSIIN